MLGTENRIAVAERLLGTNVSALFLGRRTGNWRYGDIRARQEMAVLAEDRDLEQVLVLHPDFSDRVVSFGDLRLRREEHAEGATILLDPLRSGESAHLREHVRGLHAEGVSHLPRRTGVWISFADCPTVVFSCREQVVVCHAGLRSMFDLDDPYRGSIVRSALGTFSRSERRKVSVRILRSIGARSYEFRFDDERYGERNRKLIHELRKRFGENAILRQSDDAGWAGVHLPAMIEYELMQLGLEDMWWDGVNTATATDFDGSFKYWSARRGDSERNAALIYRS